MKRLSFLLTISLCLTSSAFSQIEITDIHTQSIDHVNQIDKTLSQVDRLLNLEDYEKASDLLKKTLTQQLSSLDRKKIETALFDINIQLLFSRKEMPGSQIHIVEAGDTLGEIAEKYSTTIDLIKTSNNIKSHIIYVGQKLKIYPLPFTILVDKSDNILELRSNGKLFKRYDVATGKDNKTPVGNFKITTKLIDPTWYHAGAVVPPDSPDNILGTRWLGINEPSYGIHGTTLPESIGTQSTLGCVRMFNHDVEELFKIVPSGTEVIIQD